MESIERNRIFVQVFLWWGIWLFISFFLMHGFESPELVLLRGLPVLVGIMVLVPINVRYLLPRLFFKKKYTIYVLAGVLLLFITVVLLDQLIFPWPVEFDFGAPPGFPEKRGRLIVFGVRWWMGRFTPFVFALLGNTLVEIARFANKKEKEAIHSEKEKLETEVKFLKSQVNPHFLFNALNNIYSLALAQAPQTPESVMQLSEILRYMVYESDEIQVPLSSEISYIRNFVDLNRLKDSRGMNVQLDLDNVVPGIMVAPLLFIPFVENAFKHSQIENLKYGYIRIQLKADTKKIEFRVTNSIPEGDFTKDKVGGVGLENIKKRLELLYPGDCYELNINQRDDHFDVILKISLQ